MKQQSKGARCAAFVGPQAAGKTSLVRAMIDRAGSPGPELDASAESREFSSGTDLNIVRCDYLGDEWTFLDCPGSIEFLQASYEAMSVADIVVLVADAREERAASFSPFLKFLDDRSIPHILFINKVNEAGVRIRDTLAHLQSVSARPLVLRQTPIRENDAIAGAVDLVSERAWRFQEGQASALIEIPGDEALLRELEDRETMLDTLADHDDALMEQILEDKTPPCDQIYDIMKRELQADLIVPTFIGSALHGNGVTRLFKLLRHDAPDVAATASRLGVAKGAENVMSIFHVRHLPHTGKLSFARIWKGGVKEGDQIEGSRLSGIMQAHGENRSKIKEAVAGDIVGLARLETPATGDLILDGKLHAGDFPIPSPPPLHAVALQTADGKDDVKLSAALAKLRDEDPSLIVEYRSETGETILRGQGDVHLRLALFKLSNRYNIEVKTAQPKPAYRETIRKSCEHHARHKKQSGGHGQFADIRIRVAPLPRGKGMSFAEEIHGGAVPRQFIPAVEAGVKEGLQNGPLGFPVVDIAVTLYDGMHHPVDSNEMSFKTAGRQAIKDAIGDCEPVLLEPFYKVSVHSPQESTSKIHGALAARRGQVLGFDEREGWRGWDTVNAMMPESGLQNLIIELRSLTQGAASYEAEFDHYQELYGRDADSVILERKADNGR